MVYDKDFKVRKSLASSLCEVSNILGSEITEKELVPVMEKFYKEEGEIQAKILRSMPKFMSCIGKDMRFSYLDKLKKLLNPREKWRVRMEYSAIIGDYANIFDEEITYKQIFPIALNFCVDDVNWFVTLGKRSEVFSSGTYIENPPSVAVCRYGIQAKDTRYHGSFRTLYQLQL